ncbi:MAG: hypothetical protein A2096_03060 [Spirochaetes bacterium GWF1_41_5]|nr:MAG: hypothetical protein A2096_03060 [Spirochaetes bacterium GWF1_41_5]
MSTKPRILIYLEYLPAKLFLAAPRLLPFSINLLLGKILGLLCYYLIGSARKTGLINLGIAFPGMSGKNKKNILKKVFINTGYTAFELINFPRLDENFFSQKVSAEGFEHVQEALSLNRGIIICTGHFFNWEIAAAYTTRLVQVNAIVRLLDNPLLDAYVENYRTQKGIRIIPRQYAVRRGIQALRKNEILAVLVDQNSAAGGVFVPFFGLPASTTEGAAFFHKATGAPVICGHQFRYPDHTHRVFYSQIMPLTGNLEKDTALITSYYEKIITERPENWLWIHPRWKKRPPGEKGLYPGIRV